MGVSHLETERSSRIDLCARTIKNIQISDSIVEKLFIEAAPGTGRIELQNITRGLAACNPG